MRVLILNEDLGMGGVESMLVQLSNGLAGKKDFQIIVAAAPGPLVQRLDPKVTYLSIPKYSPSVLIKVVAELAKIISQNNPDIIHSQGAAISILAGIAIKRINSKAINVLTRHSRKPGKIPTIFANYLLDKYCDKIITISQSTHEEMIHAGIEVEKISLIPNFVDYDYIHKQISSFKRKSIYQELSIPEGGFVVTMAGRLIAAKRFDKFIKILALASSKSKIPLFGLILGDGELRNKLETIAEHYSERVKIIFLGYQSNIYKYLAISDLFLFPSEHPEVLPMVVIEALSAGIPVVCSNIPGNRDIIDDGFNGFLVNGSENEYVDYILKILCDKKLANDMSCNAKLTSKQKFDKKVVVNDIVSLYKDLMKSKNSR